ncbi:hypothetical protein [Nocardia wallacei]|uniref:hypothetical protein n=1 Tax=Nocardia wallacei TaxID=480035 RepID=UPI0024581704|nr:hypothetical protein [Nocardia wallacei]
MSEVTAERCREWQRRIEQHPIVCPAGSSALREQILRSRAEQLANKIAAFVPGHPLDILPFWRACGSELAALDADLRHALACEGRDFETCSSADGFGGEA